MAYTANYTTNDLSNIFVDIIGTFGVAFVGFAGLIVLTFIVGVLLGKWASIGRKFR